MAPLTNWHSLIRARRHAGPTQSCWQIQINWEQLFLQPCSGQDKVGSRPVNELHVRHWLDRDPIKALASIQANFTIPSVRRWVRNCREMDSDSVQQLLPGRYLIYNCLTISLSLKDASSLYLCTMLQTASIIFLTLMTPSFRSFDNAKLLTQQSFRIVSIEV